MADAKDVPKIRQIYCDLLVGSQLPAIAEDIFTVT